MKVLFQVTVLLSVLFFVSAHVDSNESNRNLKEAKSNKGSSGPKSSKSTKTKKSKKSKSSKVPKAKNGLPLLADLEGWVDGKVKWHTPPSGWGSCGAVTTVYGVAICVSKAAWKKKKTAQTKADHIAQVFYQLIDNDADGVPDDPVHLKHMVDNGYLLWVPLTDKDSKNDGNWPDEVGVEQMTGIFEAVPGTCDSPANRGADPKDRNTWAAVVENTQGCDPERDATTEEIHHLMATAAGELWPDLWAPSFKSEAGKAIELTNGNCGWGFKKNWINPSSNKCEGQYAYDDRTCDEACIVVEGIYWASVSYIGGLYTKTATDDVKSEWLMATPNDGMTIYPKSVTNAKTLETGSPALYKLISTTETESGHKWLPAIMPDGKYMGKQTGKCTGISKKKQCKKAEGCEWKKNKCQLKPTTTTCEVTEKGQCIKAEGCGWKKKKCQPCKNFTSKKVCGKRGCTWSGDACI